MSESKPAAVETAILQTLFTNAVHGLCGARLAFRDKKQAEDAADSLSPSYALLRSNGSMHLVYLVNAEEGERLKKLVAELQKHDDDNAYAEFDVIAPDADYRLHDDDADYLASGGAFDPVTVDEIATAFLPPIEFYNDAEIRNGPINPDFLRKMVRVSRAPGKDHSYWAVSPEMAFGDVLAQRFTKHVADKVKDNWATVFASLIEVKEAADLKKIESQATRKKAENGQRWPVKNLPAGYHWAQRTKNTVGGIYALGIDVDDGTSFDTACTAVDALGYFALLYTTHSHGSRLLDFSYAKMRKWSEREGSVIEKEDLTNDDVKAFLTSEGKYKPHVVASVRNARWEQTPRGVLVYVDIDPIDKFRIVFLLEAPYVPSSFKMDSAAVETQWREIVLGVGAMLGVKPDKAATDLCRLFFEPRHHPDRPDAKIVIYAGDKLLDWSGVERVKEEKVGKGGSTAPDRYVVEGINLQTWAKHFAHAFMPTTMLDAHCDDRIRHRHKDSKFDVECPHDEDHTNVGDPADRGGFVADADDKGFSWGCQHDSCKSAGRDRLDQIKKAIEEGWFGVDALTDPEFSNMVPEDFEAALAAFREDNAKAMVRGKRKRSGSGNSTGFPVSLAGDGTVSVSDDGRFKVDTHEDRLWFWIEQKAKNDDDDPVWLPCCPTFKVISTAVDASGGSATITIAYETRHNGSRELTFAKDLIYDRQELLKRLSSNLFPMLFEGGVIDLFKLLDFPVDTMLVERTGWHGGAFLHPSGAVLASDDADAPKKLRFRGDRPGGDWRDGTLDGWKAAVAPAFDNDASGREQFALGVMAGCAGTVAGFVGMTGFPLLNLHGNTSRGKSTSLMLAASASGAPNQRGAYQSLRKTDNGMESILSARSGITVAFDEGKTTNADTLDNIVWMMAQGVGKTRATVTGDSRVEKEFRGFAMTANEVPLAQMMAQAKKSQPGGFYARVCDVDVSGVPELAGVDKSSFFTSLDGIKENYGHAWEPVARHLQSVDVEYVATELDRLANELAGADADAFTRRSAKALALVWYSGTVMQELGLIPACELGRIVLWAWGTRAMESTLDPFRRAMEALVDSLATRRGVDIYEWDSPEDRRYHKAAAFILKDGLEEILLVSRDRLSDLCGGHMGTGTIRDQMNAGNMLVLEGEKKKRPSWSRLPDKRSFSHFRIRCAEVAKFLQPDDQP